MSGQANIGIGGKQWLAALATAPWELTQGLSGIPQMPTGTGMFFDLGFPQSITVTTVPMLFPLDIAFLSEGLVVTEVYHNVQPGYLVTSRSTARYFLEVNDGELEGIAASSQASIELLSPAGISTASDWMSPMVSFVGFMLMGIFMVGTVGSLTESMVPETTKALLLVEAKNRKRASSCGSGVRCEICQKVSPRDYSLLSWVGAPVPDYSFAVEPATIERKIDEVLKTLKEGVDGIQQSENFRTFLLTMSKFHDYSIGNLILIMLQKPNATRVAGFSTWKDLYRWVKKGEKGIAILAPCMPPKEKKLEPPPESAEGKPQEPEEETEIRPIFFKVVYVFDVSQTEGKPLPEFDVPSLTGVANEELFANAVTLTKAQGIELSFEPRPDQDPDIKGIYFGKTIWVKADEPRAQQLKTLLHELAHYYSEGVFRIPRQDAETIAESVAFTVGARFGFDTGTRSFPYVALWSKDKKVLEKNLAAIRKVATTMIEALEKLGGGEK